LPLAAQAATVNINVPADWPAGGVINLNNTDVLNIAAAAGSPAVTTTILLAANANVTINGSGAMVTNLRIQDAITDTASHNVSINNLHITAGGSNAGYTQNMGVLVLTGDNEIAGVGSFTGIASTTTTLTITSTSGGTLTASSNSGRGLVGRTLNIEGSADVTATSATDQAIEMSGASNAINVAAGAKLTATSGTGTTGISSAAGNLAIACDGTLTASGANQGIYASGQSVSITGSGTVSATGTNGNSILADSLTVDKATVNATSAGASTSLNITGTTNVALTHGATLNVTGGTVFAAFSGPGFTLDAGSSVTLANNSASAEQHPFTMSAAGTWQLSGSAAFVAPATATSSPATITIPAATSGTIRLGPASGGGGSGTAVPTLGEWALGLLALLLGGTALTMRRGV